MKILLITATRIGDTIISTTLVEALKKLYPQGQLTIAVGEISAPLFQDDSYVSHLILVGSKKYNRHWWHMWRSAIGTCWDLVIDLRGSALSYMLLTRKRLIWRPKNETELKYQQLARLLSMAQPPYPALIVSPMRQLQMDMKLDGHGAFAVIAPMANWEGKQWPKEYFIELLRNPIFKNYKFHFMAAPHEQEMLTPFRQAFAGKLLEVSSSDHLLDGAALLKRASFFLGNDSGLMHMAAALNVPTLGLFGPSNDRYYAPVGKRAYFIRTPESYRDLWAKVKAGQTKGLMDHLTPSMVLDTLISNKIIVTTQQFANKDQ